MKSLNLNLPPSIKPDMNLNPELNQETCEETKIQEKKTFQKLDKMLKQKNKLQRIWKLENE